MIGIPTPYVCWYPSKIVVSTVWAGASVRNLLVSDDREPVGVDGRGAHRVAGGRVQRLAELPDGGRPHQVAVHVRPAAVERDAGQAARPARRP